VFQLLKYAVDLIDFQDHLDGLIVKLRTLKRDNSAEAFYDLMSGSLVWSDEKASPLTREEMGCMRTVFHFRSSVIIGKPAEETRSLWDKLRDKYPDWIGFDPSRCQPSENLSSLYFKLKNPSDKAIKRLFNGRLLSGNLINPKIIKRRAQFAGSFGLGPTPPR
jgi:hypothetical protein